MLNFLNGVRCADKKISITRQIADTVGILLFGAVLGIVSKYLDCTASNELPLIIAYLDVSNFLGRFAIWILLGVCVSVYSASPMRAGINGFVFFAGMVASYYLYSAFAAGFFPKSYAMIWIGFTVISPVLAWLCWYTKGKSRVSLILSAGVTAVLLNMTFVYEWLYVSLRSPLELLALICGIIVIKRETMKETALMVGIGIVLAFAMNLVFPFGILS